MIDTFNGKAKFRALFDKIEAAGHSAHVEDNLWVFSDQAAVTAIIDGFTLADAIAPIVMQIKAIASQKILAFLPEWKQSNLNARMNELNDARFSRTLTDAEAAEVEAMRAVWAKAKAIRAASNMHEANIAALSTFDEIKAYDITANWPEV